MPSGVVSAYAIFIIRQASILLPTALLVLLAAAARAGVVAADLGLVVADGGGDGGAVVVQFGRRGGEVAGGELLEEFTGVAHVGEFVVEVARVVEAEVAGLEAAVAVDFLG